MRVSVIIPAYNEEKILGTCLESLKAQEVPPYEIIVVNNNSRDKTREVAESFGVRVIDETKQGITPARNAGFNAATGDIIARTDADTEVPPDWVKKIIANFEAGGIDALGGVTTFTDSGFLPPSPVYSMILGACVRLFTGGANIMWGMNMALTRDMWLRVRGDCATSDKLVHEDLDISLKIHKNGGKVGVDLTMLVRSSARRMTETPLILFIEYPLRFLQTIVINAKYHPRGPVPAPARIKDSD